VSGRGFGGRNQEFVLYAALRLAEAGIENAAVLSCGTDGIDGNSVATGAIFSSGAIKLAEKDGLDVESYLRSNDSSSFFLERGGLVVTGHTGNNIRDLRIFLAG
jgi:hydroxypyruvate reductase